MSVKEQVPSRTRSRIAWPLAGDRPKPTPDIVATVTLPGFSSRSMIGRPSGVFSITPAQERMTLRCAARGNISATRRARLRTSGEVGRAFGPVGSMSIHSCGPPPKARLPRKVWRPYRPLPSTPPIFINGAGSVTIISARAEASGKSTPKGLSNIPDCGPAATTKASHAIRPRGVCTATTLPPAVSIESAGQCCRMRPPRSCNAQA